MISELGEARKKENKKVNAAEVGGAKAFCLR
jgi:hypothetical protein